MAGHAGGQAGRAAVGAVVEVHARHVYHVASRQHQGVVARAGQVDHFHTVNAAAAIWVGTGLVGHLGQVKRHAAARQHDHVDAAAAVDAGQLRHVAAVAHGVLQRRDHGLVNGEDVVAGTAIQHACCGGRQAVVACTGHQGLDHAAIALRVGRVGAHPVHRCLAERACGVAKDHVAATSILVCRWATVSGRDDQVGQAVAVHIPCARHAGAADVTHALAVDHKTAHTSCHGRQVDVRARCLTKHHIGATSISACCRVAVIGPDDQVG